MRIEKNKIVFGSVIVIVLLFIIAYSTYVLTAEEKDPAILEQPLVPALEEDKKNYTSKMDALNDLKEVRKSDPPSIYSEKLLDSLGVFDPALEEKEKDWILDSIYRTTPIGVVQDTYSYEQEDLDAEFNPEEEMPEAVGTEEVLPDLASDHERFFLAGKSMAIPASEAEAEIESGFMAVINGDQTVRTNDRLELHLKEDVEIGGEKFPKNTAVYAFVTLQPNRVQLKISHIAQKPVKLKVYDLQDSNEGIYIENTFRAGAGREVLDDVVQDINIAGLPQVGGIKNIFRKNNRNLKVTIMDQYQLNLKPEL